MSEKLYELIGKGISVNILSIGKGGVLIGIRCQSDNGEINQTRNYSAEQLKAISAAEMDAAVCSMAETVLKAAGKL